LLQLKHGDPSCLQILIIEPAYLKMDIKEKALLYRAHAGDRGAAGTLYEHYYRDIYSYIYYRVNNPSTTEDLSAEVFVRMIRHLPGFLDQGKPFISWLYSLAKKVIQDYQRDRVNLISAKNISGDPSNGRSAPSYGRQIPAHEQHALGCFQKALQHLTDSQKEIIIHRFVEGRSVKDIADLINQSEGAVKIMQLNALKSLEEALVRENCI
jgi:RNA polymerase sigma-70 factor (ECF subfamily)